MRLERILLVLCLSAINGGTEVGQPSIDRVVDAASLSGKLAPGMIISIFGERFTDSETVSSGLPLAETLADVTVRIADGDADRVAPLFFVSAGQINAQLPFGLVNSKVSLRVQHAGGEAAVESLEVGPRVPRLFTEEDGLALSVRAPDRSPVKPETPAIPGDQLICYLTGLGDVEPAIDAGHPALEAGDGGAAHLVTAPVSVRVGEIDAAVLSAGLTPGAAGLYQVAFELPFEVPAGEREIVVEAEGERSQPEVRIPVGVRPAREFFVSPRGARSASGSFDDPWDLATALGQSRLVRPGDTVWLRGGVYGAGRTTFTSSLRGEPNKPVVVRQYAGERATVNGGIVANGAHTWFWGFEVACSEPDRASEGTPHGFVVNGPGTRLINLVIHDTSTGVGLWTPAIDAEVYGSLIYYNGWQGPDRGHGHGIYTQNDSGTKLIADNIIFNQFGLGIQAFGSEKAFVRNYRLEGNVVFNNGSISTKGLRSDNILFAVGGAVSNVRLQNNYTYHTPAADDGYCRLGWQIGGVNANVVVLDNYWIGGHSAIELWNWDQVTYKGNRSYSNGLLNIILFHNEGQSTSKYEWDGNTYYGSGTFRFLTKNGDWKDWREKSGVDKNSEFLQGRPKGIWAFVRPNKYEPGRGHIVVYNWDLKDAVDVDVANVLKNGARYEVRDAMNFYGDPVLSGRWSGGALRIPITSSKIAAPAGTVPTRPVHTGPEFNAFVLLTIPE